jgi:signal transduction histidine kinase
VRLIPQREPRRRESSVLRYVGPLLIILGLLIGFRIYDPAALVMLRNSGHDLFQGIAPAAKEAPRVAVVQIGEPSLAAIEPWPWPRDRLAQLVDQVVDAGATTIVLADLFHAPDRFGLRRLIENLPERVASEIGGDLASFPDPDLALAQSLRRTSAVVATSLAQTPAPQRRNWPYVLRVDGTVIESRSAFPGLAVAIPPLREAAAAEGAVNLFPERDMILRRVPTVFLIDGEIHPALPIAGIMATGRDIAVAARRHRVGGVLIDDALLRTDELGRIWLDYTRMVRIPVLEASDIASAAPGALRDRIVVIGVAAPGIAQRLRIANGRLVSGPEVIAVTIDAVLTGTGLSRTQDVRIIEISLAALLGGAVVVIWLWLAPLRAFGLTITVAVAWVGTTAFCRSQFGLVVDALTPVVIMVLMAGLSAAARALHLARERERLITERFETEQKLFQAQKMEAVGELTSGIAHDFNNLLAVIYGNLELIKARASDPGLNSMIEAAIRSVHRGTNLIRQLLLFSRRADLNPRTIDLSRTLESISEMVRVSVPAAVDLETRYAENLWPVKIDEDQFAAAILNLVINAKDAMPDGGKLTIETANRTLSDKDITRMTVELRPGHYVMVAISDTGYGMVPDIVARAFDPFFTTKSVGKGTGLGLAMVVGFARQSAGDVAIDSKPGQGTSVRLYFPARGKEAGSAESPARAEVPSPGKGERILVTEDQDDVRSVVVAHLKDLGYDVVEASEGSSALDMLASDRQIDLLLTDMAMPGDIQGPELAKRARRLRPEIRIVLMTGYPKGSKAGAAPADAAFRQIAKPISKSELAQSIWAELNR